MVNSMTDYCRYIDHTLLKPEASSAQIRRLCDEAREFHFHSVCVNSSNVRMAAELLKGTDVAVAAVTGFPLGAMSTAAKAFETETACADGASEIDMVINIGRLKDRDYDYVREDIRSVVTAASKHGAIVKTIIETCLLDNDEKAAACRLAEEAGAAFVKTSTGFGAGGATCEDIIIMRENISENVRIKASGGIRTFADMKKMLDAGADRIGASASVNIIKETYRV